MEKKFSTSKFSFERTEIDAGFDGTELYYEYDYQTETHAHENQTTGYTTNKQNFRVYQDYFNRTKIRNLSKKIPLERILITHFFENAKHEPLSSGNAFFLARKFQIANNFKSALRRIVANKLSCAEELGIFLPKKR